MKQNANRRKKSPLNMGKTSDSKELTSSLIRTRLLDSLIENNAFWSYDNVSTNTVDDEMLISKTLLHLDINEINQLFTIYSIKKIKKVWLENLVPQGEYLYTLNKFFAWYYFGAKRPGQYVKAMETRYLNRQFA